MIEESGQGKTPSDATNSREVARKINGEVVLLLGWSRAILLLLAHPLVASGVAEHSSFEAAPEMRVKRLRQTIEAMLALSFGTLTEADRAARKINAIHDRVRGKLRESAGNRPAGTPYSAHDPELLGWVHVTLLDSLLLTYELFVGPLSPTEKDRYCAEALSIEPLLAIPSGTLPGNFTDLRSHLEGQLASGQIEITETARRVAREVVSPDTLLVVRPLLWLLGLPTIGLLPPSIRKAYGYRWTRRHEACLRMFAATVRTLLPWVSSSYRHWPHASRFWFGLLERSERVLTN